MTNTRALDAKEERAAHGAARRYCWLAPRWMDVSDLVQEGRMAQLRGAIPDRGIIDALRLTHRIIRKRDVAKGANRMRGWEQPLEEQILEQLFTADTPETLLLAKEVLRGERDALLLIATLPEEERVVLQGVREGRTQVSIAIRIGKDQSRVSLIKKEAVAHLQELLGVEKWSCH